MIIFEMIDGFVYTISAVSGLVELPSVEREGNKNKNKNTN